MLAAWLGCALCVQPGAARAYSDPTNYQEDPELGGGGGRYFTGSSADGFGCEVCHQGGAVADLSIRGLPLDGFTPGAAYELTISWPPSTEHLALMAEFTDEARMGAGTLALPRPDATPEPERCSGELLGQPSSGVLPLPDGSARQLVSVIDCGAHQVRFLWTAPIVAPEAVWLQVGFVASNDDATPEGDGVTMARRVLLEKGASEEATVVAKGCDATRPGGALAGSRNGSLGYSLALLVALAWRRARQTFHAADFVAASEEQRCKH